MSTTIPARDLRNNYGQIIERVRGGEHITVVTDGVPVVDLIPHVDTVVRPRFRPTDTVPTWTTLSRDSAADWLADIRRLEDDLNHSALDPWESR